MEIVNLILNAITALAAIAAAVIAWKTLGESKDEQKEGLEREKRQATLDAYNKLQEQVLDKLNLYMPAQIKEIATDPKSEKYKTLSTYLARIEHFCVGLEMGIYDYETFYALAHGYFDSDRGILKPRLLPLLDAKKDQKTDYFENLHAVWNRMDEMSRNRKQ